MTTHPSIPAAPAVDSEFTARMAEIRDRIEQATPGPWHTDDGDIISDGDHFIVYAARDGHIRRIEDKYLFRHAPSDLAYLLDGLLAMQAQRDAARASLAEERRVTALQARQYQAAREEAQAAHREALAACLELGRAEAEAERLREALEQAEEYDRRGLSSLAAQTLQDALATAPTDTAERVAGIASSFAVALIEKRLREGATIEIPSLGLTISGDDPDGAQS